MTIKQPHLPRTAFRFAFPAGRADAQPVQKHQTPRGPLADALRSEVYGNYQKGYADTLRRLPAKEQPAAVFLQAHKSYVVPLKQIERLATGKQPTARGGQVLPLGATSRQDLLRHRSGTVG